MNDEQWIGDNAGHALRRLRDTITAGAVAPPTVALRTHASRWLRARRATAGGMVVVAIGAIAFGSTAVWQPTASPPVPPARTPPSSECPAPVPSRTVSATVAPPQVTPIAEDLEPVPLTLLAVNGNLRSFAVMDLAAGTVTTYPPGAHHLPMANPTDGATITSRGDALVWPGPGVYVLPGGDFSRPPIEITPSHLRCSPADALAELFVAPSPDGSRLWIVHPDTLATSTRIELVDIDTAEVLVEAEVERLLFPNAATDDSLVLHSDEGEVQRGIVVRGDAGVDEIAIGTVIAVHDDVVVTLDPDRTTLRLVDLETEQTRTVVLPTSGSWYSVAGPSAEGYWTPMPTVSAGGELLMSVVREHDAGGNPVASTLYAISLADTTSRPLAEFGGRTPDATWSRDGNWVVLFPITRYDDHAVQEVAVLDPDATDAGPVVVATVPAEHLVVGAS